MATIKTILNPTTYEKLQALRVQKMTPIEWRLEQIQACMEENACKRCSATCHRLRRM